jgi:hypothetical protein
MKARYLIGAATLSGLIACTHELKDSGLVMPIGINQFANGESSNLCKVDFTAAQPSTSNGTHTVDLSNFTISEKVTGTGLADNRLGPEGELLIFYGTNDWSLKSNDIADLRSYFNAHPPSTKWVLEGHADKRGPESWNHELGWNRAGGISELFASGAKVFSYGESTSNQGAQTPEDLAEDRYVKLVNGTPITRGLNLLEADIYLVDQSGSMSGPKWEEVSSYGFSEGSLVYTFTGANRSCGGHIKNQSPGGSTPLYSSLAELIGVSEAGKTITVLTDGGDTENRIEPNTLNMLASEKGLTVNIVGLNVSEPQRLPLESLASITGGKVYFGKTQ